MKIWVIYTRPSDFPNDNFVVREHDVTREDGENAIKPTPRVHTGETIGQVRRFIPRGKQRLDRTEADEPQIVEWWF